MGTTCSSEQGDDFYGPARPRQQPSSPDKDEPVETPKAANDESNAVNRTPEVEDHFSNGTGTHRSRPDQNNNDGSARQYRTQTIRQPKVKIERKLWGRPKPDEGQDTLNAKISREAKRLTGDAKDRYEDMKPGPAPPGDDARRRAEGKMHTTREFLEAMGEKRRNFYEKQAEAAKKAEEDREAEDGAPVQKNDMLSVNHNDVEDESARNADQEPTMAQSGNKISDNDENVSPTLNVSIVQECMNANKHAIEILRSDMDTWLKANIMCYDIRHYDVTVESWKKIERGEVSFAGPEKIIIDQLLVPYPIPNHVFLPSPHPWSGIREGMMLTLGQLKDHLRNVTVESARDGGKEGTWKITFFKELAPYFEYALGIFDDGRQLENRLWFLQLMEQYGSPIPAEELAKWDEKMSGVYGVGDEARTAEVASSWRVASSGLKRLSEWINIVNGP
ncbi:hypothetical protein BKA64DRAFT_738610 [Cadophora sp. MPI-SDFR-AT-0126]|nr:hypothetical protein BKA64DRAFT_738610 [Leotiomycetes sp. MPI-SDFR-AT-0126]